LFNPTDSPILYQWIDVETFAGGTPLVHLGPGSLDPGESLFLATLHTQSLVYAYEDINNNEFEVLHFDTVPEPATLVLLGGGLALCLSLAARRRARPRLS
jgi:hypothetical protein